ncbi:hypothetical protein JB92DRAFT_3116893 [Gautieria morchelliformis]|nr:hypothetical protein JB92DRAFT_3116893 [Gautieria morchelliformis]
MDESITRWSDSPIKILPLDLLAEIFEHCACAETSSPVLLSHVSTLWRHIATTTPSLWHTISYTISVTTHLVTSEKIRTWLARSGSFPLYISLDFARWPRDAISLATLDQLRTHSHHWGRWSVTATDYTIASIVFLYFMGSPRYDLLSRLDLKILGPVQEEPEELAWLHMAGNRYERRLLTEMFARLMKVSAPRFTEFNLTTDALPYELDPELQIGLPHLRALRIFERDGRFMAIQASTVLHLLGKCPALESFAFRGTISHVVDPHGVPATMVSLPRLRELHVAQTCLQRTILTHLITPALQVLRLSWLNQPDRPDPFVDEDYMAETNEEPTEWSQSPYTDILTGLGIRSLICRGAPPIRVLDMDFADARSPKDFIWVFEHVPTLESFRIIGSDMSDKVLIALASKNNQGKWLCPRLASLELSRCDLITGRGVVTLAKGRNPCKDRFDGDSTEDMSTEESRPARLKKFVVEGCARVDCESVALVQYQLGNVGFEVDVVPAEHIFLENDITMPP